MNILVLCGGESSEREISFKSGQAVGDACRRLGHSVKFLDGMLRAVQEENMTQVDVVFNVLHGGPGESGQIQALLDQKNVCYTGSGAEVSVLFASKELSKEAFKAQGLAVAEAFVLDRNKAYQVEELMRLWPAVIKPVDGGSSLGMSIVAQKEDVSQALAQGFQYGDRLLWEQRIVGRELTVGVLGTQTLPVVEICPSHAFFDYSCKYTKGLTTYHCPASLSLSETQAVDQAMDRIKKGFDLKGFYRVDFILDAKGIPFVLEVNTIPGFTETSLVPLAAKQLGLDFEAVCEIILTEAIQSRECVRG